MREIAARMREAATKVGTTSTLWDVVFDAEAILTGEVSWADRKTVERSLEEWAGRHALPTHGNVQTHSAGGPPSGRGGASKPPVPSGVEVTVEHDGDSRGDPWS
jgi:hypothetical protein